MKLWGGRFEQGPAELFEEFSGSLALRIIVELAHERGTPTLLNIHDVRLAQSHADRIVGLTDGRIVFDGRPEDLNESVLTEIYGEEDWSTTIAAEGEKDDAAAARRRRRGGQESEAAAG